MSNNIEEDIEIIEELLKDFNCKETDYTMLFKEKAKSIENILNAYIHEKVAKEEVEELLDNSISKDKVKEKLEIAKKEYQKNLNSIDRKISHTKDEHKIRSIYADFGVKRGRLEMLEELLEDK